MEEKEINGWLEGSKIMGDRDRFISLDRKTIKDKTSEQLVRLRY